MITISSAVEFDSVITNNPLILVDCWATWCGPCRSLIPVLDQVEKEYPVAKFNIDDDSSLATNLSIRSVPTLIIFKNGTEVKRIIGGQSTATLLKALDSFK